MPLLQKNNKFDQIRYRQNFYLSQKHFRDRSCRLCEMQPDIIMWHRVKLWSIVKLRNPRRLSHFCFHFHLLLHFNQRFHFRFHFLFISFTFYTISILFSSSLTFAFSFFHFFFFLFSFASVTWCLAPVILVLNFFSFIIWHITFRFYFTFYLVFILTF